MVIIAGNNTHTSAHISAMSEAALCTTHALLPSLLHIGTLSHRRRCVRPMKTSGQPLKMRVCVGMEIGMLEAGCHTLDLHGGIGSQALIIPSIDQTLGQSARVGKSRAVHPTNMIIAELLLEAYAMASHLLIAI